MERINEILSVQALSSVHYPLQMQQLQMRMLQELERQRQRQQQHQQQQQHLHQQQLHHLQQLPQPSQLSPIQSVPAITQHSSNVNGNGNFNNHHSTSKQSNSRSSSASSRVKNGLTKKNSAVVANPVGTELIDLITCSLCKGYLIDAFTLELCMHSFCRPCALKYIRAEHRCPECNLEIKDKRFLNRLKPDVTLQNIVYKLVPGLYEKEMARRRKFYAARPTPTPRYKCEMFGDIPPAKTIKPDDMLNISLTWLKDSTTEDPIKTYLLCRADSTMLVLKKLIIGKFGLERPIKFYYEKSEILFDLTALMDIAATFDWSPERKVLALNFREQEASTMVQPS